MRIIIAIVVCTFLGGLAFDVSGVASGFLVGLVVGLIWHGNAKQVKAKLQVMSDGTAKLKGTPEHEATNAGVIKLQQNQQAHLSRLFLQAMKDYIRV